MIKNKITYSKEWKRHLTLFEYKKNIVFMKIKNNARINLEAITEQTLFLYNIFFV